MAIAITILGAASSSSAFINLPTRASSFDRVPALSRGIDPSLPMLPIREQPFELKPLQPSNRCMVMTDFDILLGEDTIQERRDSTSPRPRRRMTSTTPTTTREKRTAVAKFGATRDPSSRARSSTSKRSKLKVRPSTQITRNLKTKSTDDLTVCYAISKDRSNELMAAPKSNRSATTNKNVDVIQRKGKETPTADPKQKTTVEKKGTTQLDNNGVENEVKSVPQASTASASAAEKIKSKSKKRIKQSRSSTMPGFNYHNTQRVKAHQDGIHIVERESGRKIRSTDNSESDKSIRKHNSHLMYTASASVPDSLIQFTEEIHQESRITPAEEIELGSKTQEAIRIQNVYENLYNTLDREPTDAEYCAAAGKINMESIRQTIEDGLEAKNRLVTSNLRMVQRVVNLYIRNGLGSQYNAGDLMQDGTLALIRAAEKYEPQRGFRFSTYAMYWIRSSVKRSQILQSRVIDVPQRLHENYKKIQKTIHDFKESHGRKPSTAELAELVNLTGIQIDRCISAMEQRIYSLDAEITNPLKEGSGRGDNSRKETLYGLIENKWDETEMATMERQFAKEDLINTLRRHLTPHEVDLLLLRYGLIDEKTLPHGFSGPLTISEVSKLVGIKPDKVRRMLNNSLRQLKHLIANEWESETI